MKNLTFLVVILSFVFISCNKNKIYEMHKDLSENYEWKKDKKVDFEVHIEKKELKYNIDIAIRHITCYQYKSLNLIVTCKSPSGKVINKNYSLEIVGNDKKFKGDGSGDYWDLSVPIEKYYSFEEAGKYKFIIEHNMPQDPVQCIMQMGLIIEKAE